MSNNNQFGHGGHIILGITCLLIGTSFSILPYDFKILILLILTLILYSFVIIELILMYNKKFSTGQGLQMLEVNHHKNMRCLKFTMVNNNLLEGEQLFKGIFDTLINNEDFLGFGFSKIIILSVTLITGQEHNLHSNILIDNNTKFDEYYHLVSPQLSNYYNLQYGYNNENVSSYNVLVWNSDNLKNIKIKQTLNALEIQGFNDSVKDMWFRRGFPAKFKYNMHGKAYFSTSCVVGNKSNWYKGLIHPISLVNNKNVLKQEFVTPFFTIDLETITLNGQEVLVTISSCAIFKGNLENKIFLINHNLLNSNSELAIKELWTEYFNYLEKILEDLSDLTIFAHNLGSFDGYFIYKGLMMCYNPEQLSALIDDSNRFISITSKNPTLSIEFKDSFRIFPISLEKLCKMFGVEGKLTNYNSKFNDINLFGQNSLLLQQFVEYALQDAKALFDALRSAQLFYWDKFSVDIVSVYSTATLSLKVYRTKFQTEPIPILKYNTDSFIRNSYYGGGTDVYKAYGENIHHYDVNSLYPFAMLNPMPYSLLNDGKIIDLSNRSLETFFGFAYCRIFCPLDMLRPVLPFHSNGKTIYPVGTWQGTYFSEELKAVAKLGYQITLIRGFEFTKIDLFSDYVNHFYEIKKNSTGVERSIAKNQLNNLYGYFGRKQIGLTTQNVKNNNLNLILTTRIVKSITPINDDYSILLMYSNVNHKMLEKLNSVFHSIGSDQHYIMSNVAIAAAVTAYARIIMIPFKIHPDTLYTDTDSAFTSKPIDPSLIGIDIGLMKDELKGNIIKEAYFLGPKKYGYYIMEDGIKKEFSVFSGVPRNSLTFDEVKGLFLGKTITKKISNRFYKSFTDLKISIKDTKITIKNTNTKLLKNNIYHPPILNKGFYDVFKILFNKFYNLIVKQLKKINISPY